MMNAGAYGGEMKHVLKSATVLTPEGEIQTLTLEELELGYRTSIVARKGYTVLKCRDCFRVGKTGRNPGLYGRSERTESDKAAIGICKRRKYVQKTRGIFCRKTDPGQRTERIFGRRCNRDFRKAFRFCDQSRKCDSNGSTVFDPACSGYSGRKIWGTSGDRSEADRRILGYEVCHCYRDVRSRKVYGFKDAGGYGYFCVDNLPVPLLPKFAEMLTAPDSQLNQAAVGIDVRGGQAFRGLEGYLQEMDHNKHPYEILFLDAGDDVLLKRYKETRRQHPLGGVGHIDRGIAKEREEIAFLKIRATFILDTSKMLTRELRVELEKIFVEGKDFKNLYITVMSFGFKHGIPQDADLVFDVRFLPNPYYIEELRLKNRK